jgi:predicted ATPase
MLKRFRVNNFKSLLNFEFRPVGLNLLVGQNNAGKTNLCSSLRFLSLSSLTSLESAVLSAVGETWNLTNVHVVGKPELEFEIDCALTYEKQSLDFSYILSLYVQKDRIIGREALKVTKETLTVTGGPFKQTPLLENDGHQAQMLHEERFVQQHPEPHVVTLAPEDATMLSKLYELKDNPRATLFKRYVRSWLYFSFSPDALRSPNVLRDYPFLGCDGTNLSHAMFRLHNEKPRLERRIIEMLKPIEPNVDLFSYSSPDPEHIYMFLEDDKNHRFSARSMSDGTLRFLAMVYLLVVLDEISKETTALPLIMIEEPENGLYVGHLKPLLQKIDPSGTCGQFIYTSHNPYFIDLFDNNLEGVHVIKSGKPSSVLAKPDPNKVRSLLEQMSLGEMHYREMLA